jgi:ketosteroid isomerase-like protein
MTKRFFFLLCFFSLAVASVHAADDANLAAVRAADDQRVAATTGDDAAKLGAVLSDDLRYAHSTGGVDTKKSYLDSLASGRLKYISYEYEQRNFTFPAPGIALMTGRVHVKSKTAAGEAESTLGFLAVWRVEKGEWRFLAWQSCKLTPSAAGK